MAHGASHRLGDENRVSRQQRRKNGAAEVGAFARSHCVVYPASAPDLSVLPGLLGICPVPSACALGYSPSGLSSRPSRRLCPSSCPTWGLRGQMEG